MTVHFAVYVAATGAIKRRGVCSLHDLPRQACAGEAIIQTDGPKPDNKFKVDITQSPPVVIAK